MAFSGNSDSERKKYMNLMLKSYKTRLSFHRKMQLFRQVEDASDQHVPRFVESRSPHCKLADYRKFVDSASDFVISELFLSKTEGFCDEDKENIRMMLFNPSEICAIEDCHYIMKNELVIFYVKKGDFLPSDFEKKQYSWDVFNQKKHITYIWEKENVDVEYNYILDVRNVIC